jgi:S1-C subfamily serine protease
MLLALLLALGPADCGADQPVTFTFKASDSMETVAAWATKNLCEPHSVDAAVAKLTLPVSLQGTVSRVHARALFAAALGAAEVSLRREKEGVVLGARAGSSCDDAQRAAIVSGIHVVGDDARSVSRALFQSNWTPCVASGARIVPAMKNDELAGLKLFAIRPDSVWAALGFRNGDVLLDVNGHTLRSPDAALEAYAALKTADQLHFTLERQGRPASVTVTIEGSTAPTHR